MTRARDRKKTQDVVKSTRSSNSPVVLGDDLRVPNLLDNSDSLKGKILVLIIKLFI